MANELKASVINMKHLSQDIDDPIVVGAADANGRVLRIIFTQEAAAQLTPDTKVYLSWYHQQKKIKGYNVFTEIPREDEEEDPYVWEIHYPQSMLHEGDVLACIELVDSISIAASTNFMIHVLADPNDGSTYVLSDDFSEFKTAVIALNCIAKQMKDQMEQQKIEFEDMQLQHQFIVKLSKQIEESNKNMQETLAEIQAEVDNSLSVFQIELEATNERLDNVELIATEALEKVNGIEADWSDEIEQAKQEAIEEAKRYADEHEKTDAEIIEWTG